MKNIVIKDQNVHGSYSAQYVCPLYLLQTFQMG